MATEPRGTATARRYTDYSVTEVALPLPHLRNRSTAVVRMPANAKRIPPDFAGALGVIAKPYSERVVASALEYVAQCRAGRTPSTEGLDGFSLAPSAQAALADRVQ